MFRKYIITIGMFASLGCMKDKELNGCDPVTLSIKTNSPVAAGEALTLELEGMEDAYTYVWHGPNNFVSNDRNLYIENADMFSAGRYKLHVFTDRGCVHTVTSDSVEVTGFAAGCTQVDNTGKMSFEMAFTSVYGRISGSRYVVTASVNSGNTLTLEFNINHKPVPGVYNITQSMLSDRDVSVSFFENSATWESRKGGKVYVSTVNNRTVISFCNVSFQTWNLDKPGEARLILN